jgi:predicted  nucleic acid-binding Zn-ribbon protein
MPIELSMKTLSWIGAAGVAISTMAGGVTFVDSRYAKSPQVELIQLRLEEKILTDREAAVQQRIWRVEDRYQTTLTNAPETVKEEYRQMQIDLSQIRHEIQAVMETYHQQGYPATDSYYKYERAVR